MLEISEIFYSLQGEGPWSGRPAIFVRLSGCVKPLCPWCDTTYACGPGEKTTINDIMDTIQSHPDNFVVITGGEPFLQWDKGLEELEARLLSNGYEIQYETGGKIEIPDDAKGFKVCSPKYINKTWQFVTANMSKADVFKFVVRDDLEPVTDFVDKHKIPAEKVFIMPLGTSRKEQLDLFPSLWQFCSDNRFRFSPRLHILGFDNKKGI